MYLCHEILLPFEKILTCFFPLRCGNTSPELERNHGRSLSPLSFDCSYSIFIYMLFKLFCFLLKKPDAWPGRAVHRRCISVRLAFKTKVNGITVSVLAQVPPHYVSAFFQVGSHHH